MSKISHHNKIILIGFMGTGKSSVAEGLAQALGWDYMDVDAEIVRRSSRSIASIFETEGEQRFRQLETEVLQQLLESADTAIIATGGGAVLKEENRQLMLQYGLVIHLSAAADVIISRVSRDTGRPLLQGDLTKRVYSLLDQRKTAYDFAHIEVDTSLLTIPQVVTNILETWHNANNDT